LIKAKIKRFFKVTTKTRDTIYVCMTVVGLILLWVMPSMAACPADMVAYWKLEEPTNAGLHADFSGSNDGVCSLPDNCPSQTASGAVENGQFFDGDDGLDVLADSVFDWASSDSFSIELWIKRSSGIASREVLLAKNDQTTDMQWYIGVTDEGSVEFFLSSSSGELMTVTSIKKVDNDVWHHIVAIRDNPNAQNLLYVDGELEDSDGISYSAGFDSIEPLTIGFEVNDTVSGYYFEGDIDEVAFYNDILDENVIRSHYYLSKGYCDLYDVPIAIMPLGDSITEDDYSGAPPGDGWRKAYREPLWRLLDGDLYIADFVGSMSSGQDIIPAFDINHEGHGGFTDDQIASNVYDWISANPAEVVLLHAGTNALDTSPLDVENILDEIDRYSEKTTVVLARILNRGTYHSDTTEFNENVNAMAQVRIEDYGDKIIVVDMENGAGIDYDNDMYDNLHPNTTGYEKMADKWFFTLEEILPQSSLPVITSTPMAEVNEGALFTYTIQADGAPMPIYSLVQGPDDMTVDAATGFLEWEAPSPASVDPIDVTVGASNWVGLDTQAFTIAVNASPVVDDIPNQSIEEGSPFININLDDYVEDPNHEDAEMSWEYTGNNDLIVNIIDRVASISIPNEDWFGVETVTFRATDPDGLIGEDFATFSVGSVNDSPVMTDISDQTIDEGQEFTSINLNDYVDDPDNTDAEIVWEYSGNTDIVVTITDSVATITVPEESWNGVEIVTFKATDPGGLADDDTVTFTVNNVNDIPEITSIAPTAVSEDIEYTYLPTATDLDEDTLSWSILNAPSDMNINPSTGEITWVLGDQTSSSEVSFVLTVDDGNGGTDSEDITLTVVGVNDIPVIVEHDIIATDKNIPVAINLGNLTVEDPDNTFPNDFSIKIYNGVNYSKNENVITPAFNFYGTLTVPVSVNDGKDESNIINLKVNVTNINDIPKFIGQKVLVVNEDNSLTISLDDLEISDSDNTYPEDFTLTILGGDNYILNGHTITPVTNFNGSLSVNARVSDGMDESADFSLVINVNAINDMPVIVDAGELFIEEDAPLEITFADIGVVDADNIYPIDYTLNIFPGDGYAINGNIIVPDKDFNGMLTIPVSVFDGSIESAKYNLSVNVLSINDEPHIVDQDQIVISGEIDKFELMNSLYILDPDSTYPDDFSIIIEEGDDYTLTDTSLIPRENGNRSILIPVKVSDGKSESNTFTLDVVIDSEIDESGKTKEEDEPLFKGCFITTVWIGN